MVTFETFHQSSSRKQLFVNKIIKVKNKLENHSILKKGANFGIFLRGRGKKYAKSTITMARARRS